MNAKSDTLRTDEKKLNCDLCKKEVKIKNHEAGKFWYLKQWGNKHGLKFSGGFCNNCFKSLHKKKIETTTTNNNEHTTK